MEILGGMGDIANNTRYKGIRNILRIPGILGLGIIQDMRDMLNIRDIRILEYWEYGRIFWIFGMFQLGCDFFGLDVHFDVQAGKWTSKLGLGISRNINDNNDILGIGDIRNNTRYMDILNSRDILDIWNICRY